MRTSVGDGRLLVYAALNITFTLHYGQNQIYTIHQRDVIEITQNVFKK